MVIVDQLYVTQQQHTNPPLIPHARLCSVQALIRGTTEEVIPDLQFNYVVDRRTMKVMPANIGFTSWWKRDRWILGISVVLGTLVWLVLVGNDRRSVMMMDQVSGRSCQAITEQIAEFKTKASYCEQDSDCQVIEQGLGTCECFSVVNADTEAVDLESLSAAFNQSCVSRDVVCKVCNPLPNEEQIVCQNNTCGYVAGVILDLSDYWYEVDDEVTVSLVNDAREDIWVRNFCTTPLYLVKHMPGEQNDQLVISPDQNQEIECSTAVATKVGLEDMSEFSANLETYGNVVPGSYKLMLYYSIIDPSRVGQKVQFKEVYSSEFVVR